MPTPSHKTERSTCVGLGTGSVRGRAEASLFSSVLRMCVCAYGWAHACVFTRTRTYLDPGLNKHITSRQQWNSDKLRDECSRPTAPTLFRCKDALLIQKSLQKLPHEFDLLASEVWFKKICPYAFEDLLQWLQSSPDLGIHFLSRH